MVTVFEKIVNEWGQKLHRWCREDFELMAVKTVFLEMETEGAKARCAGSLSQYFTTRTEKGESPPKIDISLS